MVPNPSNRLSHARISRLWTLQDFGYSLILTDLVRSYNTKCRNVVQTVIFQIFLQSLPGFEWSAIVSQSLAPDQFQRIPTIPCTLQVLRWNVMRHEIVCARCAPCRESKCSLEILTSQNLDEAKDWEDWALESSSPAKPNGFNLNSGQLVGGDCRMLRIVWSLSAWSCSRDRAG